MMKTMEWAIGMAAVLVAVWIVPSDDVGRSVAPESTIEAAPPPSLPQPVAPPVAPSNANPPTATLAEQPPGPPTPGPFAPRPTGHTARVPFAYGAAAPLASGQDPRAYLSGQPVDLSD